ncbi:MAG TPA: DegT/DnrJ/EryC1/StrS family aminotransferase [Chloroflexota bacterium]
MIPFNDLKPQHEALRAELLAAAARVIDSGWFPLGPEAEAFEAEFAASVGCQQAVAVASGTEAIQLGLSALGLKPGDEVLTVSNTAVPTVSAITAAGGVPVFVDVDPDTLLMDPARLEARVGARARAIVPVHLYGQACDMDPIMAVARRHGLRVLEDAAQAHGARYKGRPVGSLGDACAWSFYPTKNLGALGDAGAITTDDPALAERARRLREYGQTSRYVHATKGINSRMDAMQAAFLRIKLPRLAAWTTARRERAALYGRLLEGVVKPSVAAYGEHVFHLYVVRAPDRDALRARLQERGIGTQVHYPIPVHRQAAYRETLDQAPYLPVTERAAAEILSLPLYPELPLADVETVAGALNDLIARPA